MNHIMTLSVCIPKTALETSGYCPNEVMLTRPALVIPDKDHEVFLIDDSHSTTINRVVWKVDGSALIDLRQCLLIPRNSEAHFGIPPGNRESWWRMCDPWILESGETPAAIIARLIKEGGWRVYNS